MSLILNLQKFMKALLNKTATLKYEFNETKVLIELSVNASPDTLRKDYVLNYINNIH